MPQAKPRSPQPPRSLRSRQRGIYALEWAIIFPVFFMLLYAIISYGLTFLVRQSMQYAVEEGARAALRYPGPSVLSGAGTPTWEHRRQESLNAIKGALEWLPADLQPNDDQIKFTVCKLSDSLCNRESPLLTSTVCTPADPCLVLVSYSIASYQSKAIAPVIPGLGLVLPDELHASASILADRRML